MLTDDSDNNAYTLISLGEQTNIYLPVDCIRLYVCADQLRVFRSITIFWGKCEFRNSLCCPHEETLHP